MLGTDSAQALRFFDATIEAQALERSFRSTRWLYYWGMTVPWALGAILGYVGFIRYGQPVLGAELVGAAGAFMGLAILLVYLAVKGPRPTLIGVGGGFLTYGFPGCPPKRLDLRRRALSVRLLTFPNGSPPPDPYPPVLRGNISWVPWVDAGLTGTIGLSPIAAQALEDSLIGLGFEPRSTETDLGAFKIRAVRFKRKTQT
jgi:hypothetical protein